jgi:hypothetical protein
MGGYLEIEVLEIRRGTIRYQPKLPDWAKAVGELTCTYQEAYAGQLFTLEPDLP